jgi:hypothetical protein
VIWRPPSASADGRPARNTTIPGWRRPRPSSGDKPAAAAPGGARGDAGGGSEAIERRLRYRLDEWGAPGCAERHISDFYAAHCAARDQRQADKFARVLAVEMGIPTRLARLTLAAMVNAIVAAIDRGETVRVRGFFTLCAANGRLVFHSGNKLRAVGMPNVLDSSWPD